MKYFLIGFSLLMAALLPLLYYLHNFDSQKAYKDVSLYSVIMFSILSFFLYLVLIKALKSPNKQLFISFTLANMLTKMICSVGLLLIYKESVHPANGKFIIPFIIIYLLFTIFETWFMVKLADKNPK